MKDVEVGIAVPLLHRFAYLCSPHDPAVGRWSIHSEIQRLFNTRSVCTFDDYEESGAALTGYGIPDFTHINPNDEMGLGRLSRVCELAVRYHEPRVLDPEVEVSLNRSTGKVDLVVFGDVMIGSERVALRFEPYSESDG